MNITIDNAASSSKISYTEMRIEPSTEFVTIFVRQYPHQTIVAYEDERGNYSGGADLVDCYTVPTVIFSKTLNGQFDIRQRVVECLKHLQIQDISIDEIVSRWTSRMD